MRRTPPSETRDRDGRSRGQVIVIFAGSIFLFIALCAIVTDVAWYWVNTLKVQRAADAAALAGAVYLPGDRPTAYSEARASAVQNGYTTGVGSVVVTPVQDPNDARQLDVTIRATVPTFFARVAGITTWAVSRTAKGLYVLPVPMGSPLAYYGVGDFYTNTSSTQNFSSTSVVPFASVAGGKWTTPNNVWTSAALYATDATNNDAQRWGTFNIPAIGGSVLDGVSVSYHAKVSTAAAACTVKTELSWDGGTTWGNAPQSSGNLTSADKAYVLPAATGWGSNHTWAAGDFANGKIQVRLTYLKGAGCGTVSVNQLSLTVFSHTVTTAVTQKSVVDPGGTTLASQGGWGAIITRGGNQQNGDAYAPANNGGSPFSGSNALYDGRGYYYALSLPAGGQVRLFDPGFCAMGGNPSGAGNLGAGDHWIAGNTNPVSTYYTLWNTNGKLGLQSAWTAVGSGSSGSLFEGQTASDTANGGPATSNGSAAMTGCDAYHDTWWTIPSGSLASGTYVLQVATTNSANASISANASAENMFAIEVTGGGSPQVYGNGKMAVYNNLQPGNSYQLFYLAKIDQATGAGKTALIDIFDPGDVPGNAVLKILSPNGASQTQSTFSYTTDGNCNATINANGWSPSDACSANNVTQITTSVGGHSSFNNTWIHIRIPLPATYGSGGLWQGGWWQIRYETPGGGNDTTTWQVSVSGNPVHLIIP